MLKAYQDYYYGYNDGKKDFAGYHDLVHELKEKFPIGIRIISEESKKDFIHKMGICLKELRETFVCLKIIEKANLSTDHERLTRAKTEANQLISIFVSSIKTSKNNP